MRGRQAHASTAMPQAVLAWLKRPSAWLVLAGAGAGVGVDLGRSLLGTELLPVMLKMLPCVAMCAVMMTFWPHR